MANRESGVTVGAVALSSISKSKTLTDPRHENHHGAIRKMGRLVRLLLAWLLTATALPLILLWTLADYSFTRQFNIIFLATLVVCTLVVMCLSAGLGRYAPYNNALSPITIGLTVTWFVCGVATCSFLVADQIISPWLLGLVYSGCTLWAMWLAWFFFWPFRWLTKLLTLGVLTIGVPLLHALVQVEGLFADYHLEVAWRNREFPKHVLAVRPESDSELQERTDENGYPQFLGPLREPRLPGVDIDRDWIAEPPELLWRRTIGEGWGGFSIAGHRAITQEQLDDQEAVTCYELETGDQLWSHKDSVRFDSSLGGPGPRATPTISNGKVFAVGATGVLNALDLETGRLLWSVNILAESDARPIEHGVCASPLVIDNMVIVCPTGSALKSLAAYDADTGDLLWQGGGGEASYSSPVKALIDGKTQILLFHADGLSGHDINTGATLWTFPWTNLERVNGAQPLVHAGQKDRVFLSTGYDGGCALIEVGHHKGEWNVEQIWRSRSMRNRFSTSVAIGPYVYGLDEGIGVCLDLETGDRLWKQGRYGHGQLLAVGELLLVLTEHGDLVLVDPNPEQLSELGRIKALTGRTWNHLALSFPYLLIRNSKEAACYRLQRPSRLKTPAGE